jgi:hypothetical protein
MTVQYVLVEAAFWLMGARMDADAVIERNRGLLAVAETARQRYREVKAMAEQMRQAAVATTQRSQEVTGQTGRPRQLQPGGTAWRSNKFRPTDPV